MARSFKRRILNKEKQPVHAKHAIFWATVTIATFPCVLLVATSWNETAMASFLYGILATLLVLSLNGIFERHLWMFDDRWIAHFEHPEFSFRLALVSGAVLLMVETALLVFFATSSHMDRALLQLVFSRKCAQPTETYQPLCRAIEEQAAQAE